MTNQTTIFVHTSASSAVLHGCEHGWHAITVGPDDLSTEQRKFLAAHVFEKSGARYGVSMQAPLDVAPPTVEALAADLQRRIDDRDLHRQRVEIEKENEIESYRILLELADQEKWIPGTAEIDTADITVAWSSTPNFSANDDRGRRLWAEIQLRKAKRRAALWAAKPLEERVKSVSPSFAADCQGYFPEQWAEREAELQRRREERERKEKAQRRADREQLAQILETHRPDVLPVWKAGLAMAADIKDALLCHVLPVLQLDHGCLTDVSNWTTATEMPPEAFAAMQKLDRLAKTIDPAAEVQIFLHEPEDETDGAEGYIVTVQMRVAGEHVYVETPIENVRT